MNTVEVFQRRAAVAEERAAKAARPEERKVWADIAADYRRFAKLAADEALPFAFCVANFGG